MPFISAAKIPSKKYTKRKFLKQHICGLNLLPNSPTFNYFLPAEGGEGGARWQKPTSHFPQNLTFHRLNYFCSQKFGIKTKFSSKKAKGNIRGNRLGDKATWKSWGIDGILALPEKKKSTSLCEAWTRTWHQTFRIGTQGSRPPLGYMEPNGASVGSQRNMDFEVRLIWVHILFHLFS